MGAGHGDTEEGAGVTTIEDAYADAGIAPPRKKKRQPEWTLQTKILGFVREFCACGHEFAAHDRTFDFGGKQHLFEAQRGIRAGWMDTELAIEGGITFRCELKWGKNVVRDGDDQDRLIKHMNALGHPTAWTNSVVGYLDAATAAGVPWRVGARARAIYLDEWMQATFAVPKLAGRSRNAPGKTSQSALKAMARNRRRGVFA